MLSLGDPAPSNMAMASPSPELSIIIPAYNEEKRLGPTLEHIRAYLATRPFGLEPHEIEVVVVDDGSVDGTAPVVQNYTDRFHSLRLVSNGINRGKGYSVRHGMHEARGRIALFADADMSLPIEEAEKLLSAIGEGNDIAIGSRAIQRSLMETHPPLTRRIAGAVFNFLVRLLIGLPFHDTQCGVKAFVLDRCWTIFDSQRVERFGFDPEILFLAQRQGLKTAEVAVRSSHDPASKVRVLRDGVTMFLDILRIRWNWTMGRYPQLEMFSSTLTDSRTIRPAAPVLDPAAEKSTGKNVRVIWSGISARSKGERKGNPPVIGPASL